MGIILVESKLLCRSPAHRRDEIGFNSHLIVHQFCKMVKPSDALNGCLSDLVFSSLFF